MLYPLARHFLFKLNPEQAHDLSIKYLPRLLGTPLDCFFRNTLPKRPVTVMGLNFANPVGWPQDWIKTGVHRCLRRHGVRFHRGRYRDPRPQSGNDKPRLFRVIPAEGIINRMGFNNKGVDHLVAKVKEAKYQGDRHQYRQEQGHPIEQGKDDYLLCMDKVYDHAGYIAVNISSPNTPGLRQLQYGDALDELLAALKQRQQELAEKYKKVCAAGRENCPGSVTR